MNQWTHRVREGALHGCRTRKPTARVVRLARISRDVALRRQRRSRAEGKEEPGRSWWRPKRRGQAPRRPRDRRTQVDAPARLPPRLESTAAARRGAGSQPGSESRRAAPGCTSGTLRQNPSGSTCTRVHSYLAGNIRPPAERQHPWRVQPSGVVPRRPGSVEWLAFEGRVGPLVPPDPQSLASPPAPDHGTLVPSRQYVSTAQRSRSLREGTFTSTSQTSHNWPQS